VHGGFAISDLKLVRRSRCFGLVYSALNKHRSSVVAQSYGGGRVKDSRFAVHENSMRRRRRAFRLLVVWLSMSSHAYRGTACPFAAARLRWNTHTVPLTSHRPHVHHTTASYVRIVCSHDMAANLRWMKRWSPASQR